ncbi:MAG: hypothetical protein QOI31_1936 [Solirubrobacterales bacterium]|jgi:hypothetical protein|nr:hypothetical protein [Solirubrobacterales bacterium]
MRHARMLAPALAAFLAAAGAGCGFGPGDSSEGEATLTVTRDYGAEELIEATREDPPESETVMRVLDSEAEIETRYGGGFVQSIEGISGTAEGGRSSDWFFYMNGVESSIGAAETEVRGGDRIWWDYRDWTEAMRVPAVVGSWPEPFLQTSAGSERLPVRVVCAGPKPPCEAAEDALADAGASTVVTEFGDEEPGPSLRLIVGEWSEIRSDQTVGLLERGPSASGVFARVGDDGIELLDERAETAGDAEGLLAATRNGEGAPTWIATGTDEDGVLGAVALLGTDELENRFAVAVSEDVAVPLPVAEDAP